MTTTLLRCPNCNDVVPRKPPSRRGVQATYCSRKCNLEHLYDRTPSRHYSERKKAAR